MSTQLNNFCLALLFSQAILSFSDYMVGDKISFRGLSLYRSNTARIYVQEGISRIRLQIGIPLFG
jgi:hypothetical protein